MFANRGGGGGGQVVWTHETVLAGTVLTLGHFLWLAYKGHKQIIDVSRNCHCLTIFNTLFELTL